jgi:hypothetical protein
VTFASSLSRPQEKKYQQICQVFQKEKEGKKRRQYNDKILKVFKLKSNLQNSYFVCFCISFNSDHHFDHFEEMNKHILI